MKIYFSYKRLMPERELIYKVLSSNQTHEFILPHLNSEKPYPSRDLFEEKNCDLVLAEVSEPATGQGIELGWASMCGIPIWCAYRKGCEPGSSLKEISGTFFEYSSPDDLLTQFNKLVK